MIFVLVLYGFDRTLNFQLFKIERVDFWVEESRKSIFTLHIFILFTLVASISCFFLAFFRVYKVALTWFPSPPSHFSTFPILFYFTYLLPSIPFPSSSLLPSSLPLPFFPLPQQLDSIRPKGGKGNFIHP